MRLFLFWSSAALVLYTYLLFPLLVLARGIWRRRPHQEDAITPSLSLIIAAHNEAAVIGTKLDNLLSLDYPHDCLEVIVASDGSDDGTNELVRRYESSGVRLLVLPRGGKAAALNAAVAAASGEVLAFSDANSIYAPHSLRALVRPFADPDVGGVAGNQIYRPAPTTTLAGEGEKQYWSLDRELKRYESASGNVISATGAIYAIRRSLFTPIPDGVTDDFYTSTGAIAQGYRLVFAPEAIAYEAVTGSSRDEYGRKVRVMTRGLRGVLLRRALLDPGQYGFYALQLFSHKVLRRLMAFPLLVMALVSPLLWPRSRFYRLATAGQATFYGLAAAGVLLEQPARRRVKLLTLPYYFCLVNLAALHAARNVLRGQAIVIWEPTHAGAASQRAATGGQQ
jgi:cellulose synthase/poly-beta-1,6-N-acetylglucosamine synthase-like glycosyltransferase